jgi:DNA-binding response OmpR family regulator
MANVLAADDDLFLLGMVNEFLTGEGYAVDSVGAGFECWEKMQSGNYDVIILDWDLPEMTGIQLLKKFRDAGGKTPVLLLTGRTDIDDKLLGLDTGADDYLTKPFQPKELSARVRVLLRRVEQKGPKPLGIGNEQLLDNGGLMGTSLAARYEFLSVIGEGGAGIVYKARHPQLDKFVAIKMLLYQGMKDEVYARFEQEARIVSHLNHPGIATIHDFGVTERKRPYMVMEYVEGQCLDDVIRERDHLPVSEAIDLFIQVCDAMAHAHEKSIIHRDLKPANIMVLSRPERANSIKMLDFGCGKLRDLNNAQGSGLTQEGRSLGTPSYMSPEQVRGIPVDERSDIYAFGCVMYEVLTGYVLHLGDNPAQTMLKQLEEDVPLMRDMNPFLKFPDELERTVAKALERDITRRFQTMLELQSALKEARVNLAT